MSKPKTAGITGIHTVGIPVTDQDKALDFYTGILGLKIKMDVPMGPGRRWIEVQTAGTPTSIALIKADDKAPAGVETGVRLIATDADTAHRHLTDNAVDVDDVLRWPGVPPMFAFRDPDGNGLEIVAP